MPKRSYFIFPLFCGLIALLLAGCSVFNATIVGSGQSNRDQAGISLSTGNNLGQTFTTRQSGLNGIEVYLLSNLASGGQILLNLYAGPQENAPIADASLSISQDAAPNWVRFTFPTRPEMDPADYYFSLQFTGPGSVTIASSSGASYLEGSAYQNGQPLPDAQLTFQLVYERGALLGGLFTQGLKWLGWLVLAGLLFVLPGWLILGSFWGDWKTFFFGERLGLAIGMSLALYPLLFLWTDLVGLHLGILYAILPPGVAISYLLYKAIRGSIRNGRVSISIPRPKLSLNLPDLVFLVLAAILFGVRFYIARPLSLPLWGDSYQHSVITQLLLDHNGLFQSWQPYAEIAGLTYHFGFHSQAAVFAWAAGLDGPQAVLWFAQILNGLAILALYPLAVRLCRNRWAGVIAVLVGGLLVSMPMFYINWGRDTQLAGQAILPAVLCLAWSVFTSEGSSRKVVALAGLAIGGLALTHYRILILAVIFFIPLFFFAGNSGFRSRVWKLAQTGLVGGLLFLPWFLHLYGGRILETLGARLSTPASAVSSFTEQYNSIGSLSEYLPWVVWLLLLLGVGWSLWKRSSFGLVLSSWCFLVVLATNPGWIGLPGTGAISNFAIVIAAYLPAAAFLGAAGGWLIELLPFNGKTVFSVFLGLGLILFGIWGGKQRLADGQFNQVTLAARPDIRASSWIRANLPTSASFLVNSFPAYGDTSMAGSDGGWWLRFLSGRQTNLPPLPYSTEPAPDPGYVESVKILTHLVLEKGINSPETLAELSRRGIQYVYVGQTQGRTGYGGPQPLEPALLSSSPHFQVVYHQDRVWIFKILP